MDLKNISADFDSFKESFDESQQLSVEERIESLEEKMRILTGRLEEWIRLEAEFMDVSEENFEDINSRMPDIQGSIGETPSRISDQVEPTIWETISALLERDVQQEISSSPAWNNIPTELKKLVQGVLDDKKSNQEFQEILVNLCTEFRGDINFIDRVTKQWRNDLGNISQPMHNLCGSVQDPSLSEVQELKSDYDFLDIKFQQLNASVKAFAAGHEPGSEMVEIGDLRFPSRGDLAIWVKDNLKSLDFPIGVFLDIYSFLARIQTGYTNTEEALSLNGMLQGLNLSKRSSLTSDKATTLSGFMNTIPPIFGRAGSGNLSLSSTRTSFLPALRTKEDWETKARNGGIKRVIDDQMPNVMYQMRDLIATRLEGQTQAIVLATTYISISQAFVIDLSRFLSDTYRDLEIAGFPPDSSWLLVTKLVVRIFGTDLDKVRSFVRGKMDVSSHAQVATDSLWGALKTIGVMQQYQKHCIENHPAISAEYVRFLVANSALGSIQRFEKYFKSIDESLKDLDTRTKAAQSTAGTALNRAEEAKKLALKK